MKKVVKLTESELIEIVKRVIQEQDNSDEGFQYLDFKTNIDECFEIIPRFYFGETNNSEDGDLGFWNKNKIPELDDKNAYNRFIKHVKDAVGYKHSGKGGIDNPEMIISEDCFDYDDEPSWKELLPYIEQMYYDTIKKKKLESQIQSLKSDKDVMGLAKQMFATKSEDNLVRFVNDFYKKHNLNSPLPIRRRISESTLVTYIKKAINEEPPYDFGDPYAYADYILEKVIDDNYADFINSFPTDDAHDEFLEYIKDNYADIILDYWGDVIGFDF